MYLGEDLGLRPEKCRPTGFIQMILHSDRGIHDAIRRVACKLLKGLGLWGLFETSGLINAYRMKCRLVRSVRTKFILTAR